MVSPQLATRWSHTYNQYDWPYICMEGTTDNGQKHIDTCDSCQCNKLLNKKAYDKITLVPALQNKDPWKKVHLDCCSPWKICFHNPETGTIFTFDIHLLSMVNACTEWIEFSCIKTASSTATANAFDKNWLCWYPRPKECGHNNGN